jgi:hypothetical protein
MDLVEVGWGDVDWIGLVQDRDRWKALVNSVLNPWVPQNSMKLSSVQTTRDFSSNAQLHGVSRVSEKANMIHTDRLVVRSRPLCEAPKLTVE